MKRIVAPILCVVAVGLFVSLTPGQDPVKSISGGVLNGKAVSLPKPGYPPAARAVGASGAVTVQVLIDENGDVLSANAVSGHPLLQAVAVEAARAAKFSPTRLQGTPVKVSGVITYNFVGTILPARLAFTLYHADLTQSFGAYYAPASLARELPTDWSQERELLNSLTFEEPAPKAFKAEEKAPPPDFVATPVLEPHDNNRYTVSGVASAPAASGRPDASGKLDARSVALIKELMGLTEARASANQSAAFAYELGSLLGTFVVQIDDKARTAATIARIESLIERIPPGVGQSSLRSVQDFLDTYKKENIRDDIRQEMITKAEILSALRY